MSRSPRSRASALALTFSFLGAFVLGGAGALPGCASAESPATDPDGPGARPPVGRDGGALVPDDAAPSEDGEAPFDDAGADAAPLPPGDAGRAVPTCRGAGTGARVRVVAGNLSTANQQWAEPGRRILAGLAPQVALLQEMTLATDTEAARQAFVASAMGPGTTLVRGPAAEIPNAIASTLPVLRSGSFVDTLVANRTFVWALIDLPGAADLFAVSVHLLTSSAANRTSEAQNLVALLQANAPPNAYLVVGGDLNTDNRNEACLGVFASLLKTAGPWPADRLGNDGTNAPRSRPYDWVLADPALSTCEAPVVLGASRFPSGLVADTRVYAPIAELAPATAEESAAAGMQHMAVVRDFVLP